jgi:hypothetical protein
MSALARPYALVTCREHIPTGWDTVHVEHPLRDVSGGFDMSSTNMSFYVHDADANDIEIGDVSELYSAHAPGTRVTRVIRFHGYRDPYVNVFLTDSAWESLKAAIRAIDADKDAQLSREHDEFGYFEPTPEHDPYVDHPLHLVKRANAVAREDRQRERDASEWPSPGGIANGESYTV